MPNEVEAIVDTNVPREGQLDFVYEVDGIKYSLEAPKTKENSDLKNGQKVKLFMGIQR